MTKIQTTIFIVTLSTLGVISMFQMGLEQTLKSLILL